MQPNSAAVRELAPTGRLRVAIALSPSPSALFALKDAGGNYRGVTVDLGNALARKLGAPVEFVAYKTSGEIVNAAGAGAWDVTFMPVDDERKKVIDFGSPYHLLESTYLVPAGSALRHVRDADRAGVRIAGIANTATIRASKRTAASASHIEAGSVDEAIELLRAGKVDAVALSRDSLAGLLSQVPGSRMLDGAFLKSTTAVAVAKNKPAALAYVSAFVEEAKAAGDVRRSFDAIGLTHAVVAPAGMKP
jgi:polar amino acid transport system substrate-binding protein